MEGRALGKVDAGLIRLLQDRFPLDLDPWGTIGAQLGMSPEEVLERVIGLKEDRVLRSVGPVLDSARIGVGASTLVAMQVSGERVEEVAGIVSSFGEVSHNYLRDNRFNLWFTLAARDRGELLGLLGEIRRRCNLNGAEVLELPARRRFKIDVRFPVGLDGNGRDG